MGKPAQPTWLKPALALAAGAAAVVLLGRSIAPAILLVLGGAALAFLLEPLARRLERFLRRPVSAVLSLLAAVVALALIVYLLVPPLIQQATDLALALPASLDALRGLVARLSAWTEANGLGALELPKFDLSELGGNLMRVASGTVTLAGNIANLFTQITMVAVLGVFFLIDREWLLLRLELLIPPRHRALAVKMGNAVRRELRLYLRGQATITLAVAAMTSLGLWLAGVRSSLILGIVAGILNLIPYFGPVLGSIPAVAAALTSGWQTALFAGIALVVVQQIDNMIIAPRIMGNITGLSPAAVLIAVFVGGSFKGILGMLVALPILMIFRTCVRVFVQRTENI
ncbi:MAG: AI-2E family transporter [Clostridiales bacterium]|nr:AI-2E family transporter [Clostridiales bacterium]